MSKKCFLQENKVKFCFNKAQLVVNFVPTHLQEVIYSSSNKKLRKQITMFESTCKIKKLHLVYSLITLLIWMRLLSKEIFFLF